jgi:uncharacterized protein YjiS (DUF1127 family)
METIMSTLTMQLRGIASRDVSIATPQPGLLARLIESQDERARRHTLSFLAARTDQRLKDLGFSADDIRALRNGELRLPSL